MKRTFLYAKLHQATVTEACLHYEGSLGIDEQLLKASGILPHEQLHIYNISNGKRFVTYAITHKQPGTICPNGACARLTQPGDRLIICCYAQMNEALWRNHTPTIILLDKHNNPIPPSS